MGYSGEQCGCCLGNQILSQEARGLARQSPGAQDWVPEWVEEVDGAGCSVGHPGYSPTKPPLLQGGSEKKRSSLAMQSSHLQPLYLPAQTRVGLGSQLGERWECWVLVFQSCRPSSIFLPFLMSPRHLVAVPGTAPRGCESSNC